MNHQIQIVKPRPQLQTLYGIEVTPDQKKILLGATAGVLAGIVLLIVVREMKKRK
jgi:uncharacterized protein (DUF697 family)